MYGHNDSKQSQLFPHNLTDNCKYYLIKLRKISLIHRTTSVENVDDLFDKLE
jgi:hypothetical protein